MNIGRNECTALATLLRNTTIQLQILDLYGNDIDDEGVGALTGAISGSQLVELFLTRNPTITIRGWERLSTLLEMPDSKLEKLYLSGNNIGDEVARIFANALRGNSKLKCLTVNNCRFTTEGWMHFSKLLCDTSSVNKTYLSNHTLRVLALSDHRELPTDLVSLLNLNAISENKGQVAMTKILQHHSHFNMQPFFEWEFKVLPIVLSWLEEAAACTPSFGEKIRRTKLSITYDFVREFPCCTLNP